jgi:hypothetical protein
MEGLAIHSELVGDRIGSCIAYIEMSMDSIAACTELVSIGFF